MTYHSPFEPLRDDYRLEGWGQMRYQGSLDDVLSKLEALSEKPGWKIEDHADLALHPPRVIRAVVDYKIANPELQLEDAVREAITFALQIYQKPKETPARTQAFREYAQKITDGITPLLSTRVSQQYDTVTWDVCSPELSEAAAGELARKIENADILFIALGHGGVAAGMDVYLHTVEKQKDRNSLFYVVRFSTSKCGDDSPRVSHRETEYLREMARGKTIVLFDEDVNTADTMKKAYEYFSDLFENDAVHLLTNYDICGELEKLKKKIKIRVGRRR